MPREDASSEWNAKKGACQSRAGAQKAHEKGTQGHGFLELRDDGSKGVHPPAKPAKKANAVHTRAGFGLELA